MSENQTELADDANLTALLSEMKRTKGSRFNASKRLEQRARNRTANTGYASAAVVVITLLPVFFPVPAVIASAIALSTVALSIFILASSLIQAAHEDHVRADQFQRCALEINSLRRELRGLPSVTIDQLSKYTGRYDDILRRYSINHDEVDYEKYQIEHPDEFPQADAEDRKLARKDVRNEGATLERLPSVIAAGTAALVAASAAMPLWDWIAALLEWFNK